jgi:hypothetical protein
MKTDVISREGGPAFGSIAGSSKGSISGSNPTPCMQEKHLKLSVCPSLTEFLTASFSKLS